MPTRPNDYRKVMIIGAGPVVIGQGCELDDSAAQGCKTLHSLGFQVVVVGSNPAAVTTEPAADATYIEPLSAETIAEIIRIEKPDAILPNLGGQTGLNLTSELHRLGVLQEHGVRVIGTGVEAIRQAEDRLTLKETIRQLGIEMPQSEVAHSVEEAEKIVRRVGLPAVIRPLRTLSGGGGLVYNLEEFRAVAERGLSASLVGQILVEESVLGWDQWELEVVRDAKNHSAVVCLVENVDAMGVHTGDSVCTTPMLTVAEPMQKRLAEHGRRIAEAIQVAGGVNIQFAHDPATGRVVVLQVNPRTSRSSAAASKATGFPIARVSSLLAAGVTLDEIFDRRGGTLAEYAPPDDHVAVKLPRWDFDKFEGIGNKLGTQMRAVGEVMGLGKTYKESLQKAIRSLDNGRYGLGFAEDFHDRSLDDLTAMLAEPSAERPFIMYEALRKGADVATLSERTFIKPWFIEQMKELVELEEEIRRRQGRLLPDELLARAKKDGFSDRYLARLVGASENEIRRQRKDSGVVPGWQAVEVAGAEDAAYYYSTYNAPDATAVSPGRKIVILGGGPTRIGAGGELDACCAAAAGAAGREGYKSILVGCNPAAVSTGYDAADRLYFEPLTVEDVLGICERERPEGVICQFGGPAAMSLAAELAEAGVNILGTSPPPTALAEDRDSLRRTMRRLGIPQPEWATANGPDEASAVAAKIGYPLMARRSGAAGGVAMAVVHDETAIRDFAATAASVSPGRPILIEKFLENAVEVEADAMADARDAFVPAVIEYIERAGVHSGDSACVIPPISISPKHIDTIHQHNRKIAVELGVVGLVNLQYAIYHDTVYLLGVAGGVSRTVPMVERVCDFPMVQIATQILLGKRLSELDLRPKRVPHFGVKEAVFPFDVYREVDPVLGPQMHSTGQVLGIAESFGLAYYKAQEAAGQRLPLEGTVLVTVADRDKPAVLDAARRLADLGFKIKATRGTHAYLAEHGIVSEEILKMREGRPNIADAITDGRIQLVINTPRGKTSQADDSYIRKTAIKRRIPYVTTLAAAVAAAKGIAAMRQGRGQVKSLQRYHADIQ